MRKDVEKYESLIRNSLLFQIDRDAEASRYKSEALKLTEYLYCYLLAINESKYIEFGAEIMDTANSCIKSFKPDCGDFLNYFNVAMSKAYKKAFAKQKEAEVRKGITVSEDDQRAIQKILKLAEYKNLDIYSDSFCETASEALGIPAQRIWELVQTNYNTTVLSDIQISDEGEEISLFDTEQFAEQPDNSYYDESNIEAILDTIEKVFSERQARQKPLLSKLITAKISNAISPYMLSTLQKYSYFDQDIYDRSTEWGVPVTAKEIAEEMNLLEASVSRTIKQFIELLKEEMR